jgi:glycosyltransferase involved in cell wall biosynthesis
MNGKIRVNVLFPFLTLSGYGRRSLDVLRALVELKWDEWDFHIASLRFGQSPYIKLDTSDPINEKIMSCVEPLQQVLSQQAEIGFFCTVPSELVTARIAKYQVLFTAGIETTLCSAEFIKGYNNMDLVITSSQHAMTVFQGSVWNESDDKGELKSQFKINKPGKVLIEGVDVEKYSRKNAQTFDLSDVPDNWNFLINGMLLQGDFTNPYGHDRKNILTTVKVFLETFKNRPVAPGLILKINSGNYSYADQEYTIKRINQVKASVQGKLPNITLIHGELSDDELVGLYQSDKVKAMLTVSAEGWGRAPLEFSCATSKPFIAAPYGGMVDYVNKEFTLLVGGSLQNVHPSSANEFLLKEAKIFYPDINQLSGAMMEMFKNYTNWEEMAKRQGHYSRTNFSLDVMKNNLKEIIDTTFPKFSVPVPIVLPKLKRNT